MTATTAPPLPCPPPPSIYTFDQNPCGNSCGKCITFLNSSLYYLAGSNSAHYIYPFAAVNSTTVVIGANIIQPNQTLRAVYGCGRKNDATFYVSSDSFPLSEINTTAQVDTGSATISRGFALVNYTQLYKLNIVDANEATGILDASDVIVANLTMVGTCAPLKGYGLSWNPVTREAYLIYSFLSGQNQNTRFIGHVDLTNGVVTPTCLQNVNRSFNSMTFDDQGQLWVLVGNAGPDTNKVFRFDNAPPLETPFIDTPATPCNHSGQEILGEGSEFGRSLEMSGDGSTIIVGARKAPFSYAKVYRRIDGYWRQEGQALRRITSSPTGREWAFSVATSYDGSVIAIGALNTTYIYRLENCTWTQMGSEIPAGGYAISFSEDGLTVATSNVDDGAMAMGRTYIYDWNGSAWVQRGSVINGVSSFDYSGFAISMWSNNRVAIGIIEFTGNGRTEVYQWSGSAWTQMGAAITGEVLDDNSGNSVSLRNDTLAIGAWQNDNNGTDSGYTRIFRWNGTVWNQLGQALVGETANDYSGTTVSLSEDGNRVAIGALFNPNFSENGQVRVYDYNGTAWVQHGADIDGEQFSQAGICSMTRDGTSVAVGSPRRLGNFGGFKVWCIY